MRFDDAGIRPVREARERMSREFGHDLRRFLAYLIREQKKIPERILETRTARKRRSPPGQDAPAGQSRAKTRAPRSHARQKE